MLDFGVNVRAGGSPSWLVDRPAARLTDLDRYPSAPDQRRAVDAIAVRHGRGTDEVALLAGAPAGLRVGYALGAREVLNRLTAGRPHWPLSTLRLEVIAACSAPHAVAEAEVGARQLASLRAAVRPESPMLVDAIVEVLR
jgi:histidinol-phosphate aminotransferase